MSHKAAVAALAALTAETAGTFRVTDAACAGVSAKQIATLRAAGVLERAFPGVYRLTAASKSNEQQLHAALLWAGDEAVAAGCSGGELYTLEDVSASVPEIAVPTSRRARTDAVIVHHYRDRAALMVRNVRGLPATGIEATLVALAHRLDAEAFEIACEDARRRRLTSIAAINAYLERWGRRGRPGMAATRALMAQLDPAHPSRSRLEVRTRRLLVTNGLTDFVREFPLEWHGRKYRYDFAFEEQRVILEATGRRWHDDLVDYEHDHEKWSVPAGHGYRIVFATWSKVTRSPGLLLDEIAATFAA